MCSVWNDFLLLLLFFFEMVIFTTLFRCCLTLFISTLKYTTFIRCCSTLWVLTLKCWFDVVLHGDLISAKWQHWKNVEMLAGISHGKQQQCKNRITIICKNFNIINWAEISPRFEQTELKFSFHVNELKILI